MSLNSVSTRRQYAIATLLVACGVAPLTPFFSRLYRNVAAACCLALAVVLCIRIERDADGRSYYLPVRVHPAIAAPLVVLWVLFALTTLLDPSTAGLRRLVAYVFASIGCAFVLPATLARKNAYRVVAVAGAFLTLIGLPTVVFGTMTIGPITLSTNPNNVYPLLGVWSIWNPTSIFRQSNPLALLAALGLLSALAVMRRTRDTHERAVFAVAAVLCAAGVRVTISRAVWGALAAVALLYVVYRVTGRNRRMLAGVTAVGAVCAAVGIASLAGFFPEPFALAVDLGERGVGWHATIEAASQRPLIGWGPGNAATAVERVSPLDAGLTGSSYFRMFAMTGLIGGVTYLVLCAGALVCALSRVHPGRDAGFVTLALLVVVLVAQAFQGLTLFGLSLLSSFGMFVVGISQPAAARRTLPVSTVVRQLVHNDTRVRSRDD
jgi:O-antigen ligase